MFLLSAISSEGYLNIISLFFVAVLANLSSDLFLYFVGDKLIRKLKFKTIKKYKKLSSELFKKFKKPEIVLILSKFVYGTRTITTITFGINRPLSFVRFLVVDIFCLGIIAFVIMLIGWFFGTVIDFNLIYKNIKISILIIISILILIFLIKKWINKKFVQLFLHTRKKKE